MNLVFSKDDWRELNEGETYENQFVIISPKYFKPEYRDAKYQLFYAVGGFGCHPDKMGNAVFGADFEEMYRQERYNILGVATEKAIEDWEAAYNIARDVLVQNTKRG